MSSHLLTPPSSSKHDSDDLAKQSIRALHINNRANLFFHLFMTTVHVGLMASSVWCWNHELWIPLAACWLLAGHFGHSKLIAFHEASHGTLNARFLVNEIQGILMGSIMFVPLSVYRFVHGRHHAYIGSEKDLEMWPFVHPNVSRSVRILSALGELLVGYFYTPFLFLHGIYVGKNIPRTQKIRIVWEYVFCLAMWNAVFFFLDRYQMWEPFLIGFLVPAVIAGNLQSLRKFTEHLGLTGKSILGVTRTVVDQRLFGNLLSGSMLRIDYHGTHHRYSKMPYYNLPEATEYVYEQEPRAVPIFASYWSAMWDMVRSLGNPRVGAQWESEQGKFRALEPRGSTHSILLGGKTTSPTKSASSF